MSRKNPPSHAISGVFVFLVLGIFAVFSTVMVLLGARAYKSTADRAAEHNAYRIGMAYVRSYETPEERQERLAREASESRSSGGGGSSSYGGGGGYSGGGGSGFR